MFARVTTVQASPDKVEQANRLINDQVIPAVRQMQGFKAGYWLVDRDTGRGMGITLWEDEQALEAGRQGVPQLRARIEQELGTSVDIQEYEVIAQA